MAVAMSGRVVARIGLPADLDAVVVQLKALADRYPTATCRNSTDGTCYEVLVEDEEGP